LNLIGKPIPKKVHILLQLGEHFNLPLTDKKTAVFDFIKSLENSFEKLKKLKKVECITFRNETVRILDNIDTLTTTDE